MTDMDDINDNILPIGEREGGATWLSVSENDTLLIREEGIPGIAENPVKQVSVLMLTLNHDFAKVAPTHNLKDFEWISTERYEILEILPPSLPSSPSNDNKTPTAGL